jgi:hypothetical protein
MNDHEAWMQQNAARLDALRAEVQALIGADDGDPRRQPQLAEVRGELEILERLWKQVEEAWER